MKKVELPGKYKYADKEFPLMTKSNMEELDALQQKQVLANAQVIKIAPQLLHFFAEIDWDLLRTQKLELLHSIDYLENMKAQSQADALLGVLSLIDSIQDTAVDVIGYDKNDIYLFEQNAPTENSMAALLEKVQHDKNVCWDDHNEMQQKAVLQGLIENNYGFAVLTEKSFELYPHLKNQK